MTQWRSLALVCALSMTLTACAPDNEETGGGGGPQPVPYEQQPESNNVNPSIEPDSYIDEEARQREEREESR